MAAGPRDLNRIRQSGSPLLPNNLETAQPNNLESVDRFRTQPVSFPGLSMSSGEATVQRLAQSVLDDRGQPRSVRRLWFESDGALPLAHVQAGKLNTSAKPG